MLCECAHVFVDCMLCECAHVFVWCVNVLMCS